jgi:hypothetical protein
MRLFSFFASWRQEINPTKMLALASAESGMHGKARSEGGAQLHSLLP